MAGLVTAILFAGAVMNPLVARKPQLARAPGRPHRLATSRPEVVRAAVSARREHEGAEGRVPARRAELRPVAPVRPSGLRVPATGGAEAVAMGDVEGGGPRELQLWDGEAVSVTPAHLGGHAGPHQWRLPRHGLGWHPDTADCGGGVTVVGGHVTYDGLPGPLAGLAGVGPEDSVACVDAQGAMRRYVAWDYLMGSVADDPADWFPTRWEEALILYTCTPELDGRLLVVRFRLAKGSATGAWTEPERQR